MILSLRIRFGPTTLCMAHNHSPSTPGPRPDPRVMRAGELALFFPCYNTWGEQTLNLTWVWEISELVNSGQLWATQ